MSSAELIRNPPPGADLIRSGSPRECIGGSVPDVATRDGAAVDDVTVADVMADDVTVDDVTADDAPVDQ